jgi:hypothetical protein
MSIEVRGTVWSGEMQCGQAKYEVWGDISTTQYYHGQMKPCNGKLIDIKWLPGVSIKDISTNINLPQCSTNVILFPTPSLGKTTEQTN